MMRPAALFLTLFCQIVLSMQSCHECKCCKNGEHYCDSNKKCIKGCIAGYYGDTCTDECLENCKTCDNGNMCTECKPGYYNNYCNVPCGKGCLHNKCTIFSGTCPCKSTNFTGKKCNVCLENTYGDNCNNTCPSDCVNCISGTNCVWCKNSYYYGSYCQYRCSHGCNRGTCNKDTGHCTKGCTYPFVGEKCDACSPGLYGKYCDLNCTERCSSCLSKTNCTECKEGLYGETCSCPFGCEGNCSTADGRCFDCKPGFYGEFCNNTCLNGSFGYNCSKLCNDVVTNCLECFADELGQYAGCTKCSNGYYPVFPFGLNHSKCLQCPRHCRNTECNISGLCSNGCLRGKWGDDCNHDCGLNCAECNQTDGKCLECTNETFSDDCSQNCSINCNMSGTGRTCASDAGKCLHGCLTFTKYGDYCEEQCSGTCNNQTCDWKKGYCLEGCLVNYYGSFCDKKCAHTCKINEDKRVCKDVNGHCLFGCKDGFYGGRCEKNCSSRCINTTCDQETGECLLGCINGYEGAKCNEAIKGIRSEIRLTVIIAGSAGAGVAFIVLVVTLAFCLYTRKRRLGLPSNKKFEENDYIHDMQEIRKRDDYSETEADVTYAQPFKSKQEGVDGTSEECEVACRNKYKITDTTNDYAVVKKEKAVKKENESIEELYNTTHYNKKKRQLHSNNEYAVLSLKFNKHNGISKPNGAQPEDGHNAYDTTEEIKSKNILHLDNGYASINSNKRAISETYTTRPLYDTTCEGTNRKMRPLNNDYDVFSIEGEKISSK